MNINFIVIWLTHLAHPSRSLHPIHISHILFLGHHHRHLPGFLTFVIDYSYQGYMRFDYQYEISNYGTSNHLGYLPLILK